MLDLRCTNCNKLLARTDNKGQVEVKCPRCKTLNNLKAAELPNFGETHGGAKENARKERV